METTYFFRNGDVEVGDSKQTSFYPQFKTKHWDNEANFSIRLIDNDYNGTVSKTGEKVEWQKGDKLVRFYEKKNPEVKEKRDLWSVRIINRDSIAPLDFIAEHELGSDEINGPMFSMSQLNEECLLFYGGQDTDSYYDLNAINYPIYRFKTEHHGNPMFSNAGMGWFLYHSGDHEVDGKYLIENICESIKEYLEAKGLKITINGPKMFFDGDKKFMSSAVEDGRLFFYINFDGDYDRSWKLYRPGVEKDTNDTAQGLVSVLPKINKEDFFSFVSSNFLTRIGKNPVIGDFQKNEVDKMDLKREKASKTDWINETYREDNLVKEDDDAFEFDIVFNSQPSTNIIQFSIQSKEFNFFKQPSLSKEDKFNGFRRPANVIGSYAVYHKSKNWTAAGGVNYMTGKAFHIYRPRIIANDGSWVFGELDIDENSGILSLTIPQEFLNKAQYPITVDPTFGYTTIGASSQATPSLTEYYGSFGTIADGTITKITSALKKASAGANNATCRTSTSTTNSSNVGTTSKSNSLTTSFAWYDSNAVSWSITSGTTYYVTATPDYGGPYDATSIAYDTGSGTNGGKYNSGDVWTAENTRNYSVYATYTASGGGAPATPASFVPFVL